jgi:DNA-binding response OmpR family regulator
MKAVYIGVDERTADIAKLAIHLRWPDAELKIATSAGEGLELIEKESPDVVLVHADFEDMTFGEAIQEIRRFNNAPILVLGRNEDDTEVVMAIDRGADDYVRLPCDLAQIMIRIWALLRRTGIQLSYERETPIRSGKLFISSATYEVYLEERRIVVTSTEFRLLHLLAKNRGTVIAHQTLERMLWGEDIDSGQLVKKYVQRLRRKLGDNAREPTWIASVHGVGYRFIGPDN